jgi:hypothetical protein
MHVYHSRWHELSQEHIENLFKKYLGQASVWPYAILPRLRKLEVATLEVLENYSAGTIYRLRQTGEVFRLGEFSDLLISVFKYSPLAFIISEVDGNHFVRRVKEPFFVAQYDPITKELIEIVWEKGEPGQTQVISNLKKVKGWLRENVK